MAVKISISPRDRAQLKRDVKKQYLDKIADDFVTEKERELRLAAKNNYRPRTGNLTRSIRRVGNRVSIGGIREFYWANIDNFTRGTGAWVRRVLDNLSRNDLLLWRIIRRYDKTKVN